MSDESSGSAPAESAPEQNNTSGENSQANSSPAGEIQAAVESGEISQAEANKLIKTYQLKVRGQTKDVQVDLSDDNFMKNQLQLAEMSKMSMQEVAEIKKAYAREMDRWKSNPEEIMRELGLDPDEWSEKRIQKQIEQLKKSPEQLASEKYQKDLEEARSQVKKLEEEKAHAERSKLEQQALVGLEQEIDTALAGHKTLPNSKETKRQIAEAMHWAMGNGFPEVTAADVIPMVEKDMMDRFNSYYDEMPDEALERYISKKTQDRLRKKRLASSPAVPSVNAVKPTVQGNKTPQAEAPRERINAKDFFRKK
jgi:uncharacterized protein YdaU (DUF1376 family)